MNDKLDKSIGCLIGGAIGDSLGWPIEFDNINSICNPSKYKERYPGW
jgi:ADP-ribosylglycohydrolase